MRDEFYADSRDVFKWSVIASLAREHGIETVLQVAMLRPDRDEGQGSTSHIPKFYDSKVLSFFRQERLLAKRDCGRVVRLPAACGYTFRVNVFLDVFGKDNRLEYFKKAARMVRDITRPAIVLVDPDNGIASHLTTDPKHINTGELSNIFCELTTGDVLVVYQHQQRIKNWDENAKMILGTACGNSHKFSVHKDGNVALIAVLKHDTSIGATTAGFVDFNRHTDNARPNPRTVNTMDLYEVVIRLQKRRQRATYGAVAGVVGGIATGIGQRLGPRNWLNSWVVAASDRGEGRRGWPTGYAQHEIDPELLARLDDPIIDNARELDGWLRSVDSAPYQLPTPDLAPEQVPGKRAETLRPGQRVRHRVFGDGTVLSCNGSGDDERATVDFEVVGVKMLAVRLARLREL